MNQKAIKYHELHERLDELMVKLESGDLGIDEALKCYEEGLKLVAQLETYLKTAENKVVELKAAYKLDED